MRDRVPELQLIAYPHLKINVFYFLLSLLGTLDYMI